MSSARLPIELRGVLGLALVQGVFAATVFTGWDVVRHVPGLPARDVVVALALAVVPAVLVSVSLTVALVVVLRAFRVELDRARWSGLVVGSVLIALAIAVVLFGTRNQGGWRAAAAIVAALPVGAAVVCLFDRVPRLAAPGFPQVLSLTGALAVLLFVGSSGLLGDPTSTGFLAALPRGSSVPLVVAALVTGLSILWGWRAPARASVGIGIALVLTAAAFAALPRYSVGPDAVPKSAEAAGPNVVLIVLDTTRRDHLGCYGHPEDLTPELDAWAADAVVYEDAFSTAHWTVPSHASMFTGQHALTHGCSREHRLWLRDEAETMAEVLGAKGYDTAALYCNPWLRRTNQLQGFDVRVNLLGRYTGLAVHSLATRMGFPAHWVDKGAGEACRAFSGWMARRSSDAPFFLFVNLLEAHAEYAPPRFESGPFLPDDVDWDTAVRFARGFPARQFSMARQTDENAERIIAALYRAEVRYQDRRLGELLRALDRWADLDETLVIITADHGENIDDAGRWDHEYAVNDTLIHVPLIIRYPKLFPAGTRTPGLCQLDDLLPTVRGVVEGEATRTDAGERSLVPTRFTPREEVFTRMYPLYADFKDMLAGDAIHRDGLLKNLHANWRVIRTPDWKYIHSSDGQHQLYDLRTDIDESDDLGDTPDAARLRERLLAWWAEQPLYTPEPSGPLSPSTGSADLDDLRKLGYVSDR